VLHEEEEAFADWMNRALSKDKHVQHHLPLAVGHYKKSAVKRFFLLSKSAGRLSKKCPAV
jgi:hypothetical protein